MRDRGFRYYFMLKFSRKKRVRRVFEHVGFILNSAIMPRGDRTYSYPLQRFDVDPDAPGIVEVAFRRETDRASTCSAPLFISETMSSLKWNHWWWPWLDPACAHSVDYLPPMSSCSKAARSFLRRMVS